MAAILMIDDERAILELVKNGLRKDGHFVTAYTSAAQVPLDKLNRYDLIILDIMMPDVDGFSYCDKIRSLVDCPILFLTAKTMEHDITFGLALGADDYLAKPYEPRELALRLEASLRRVKKDIYEIGDLALFEAEREVYLSGDKIELTKIEYEILKLLMQNPGKAFSRAELAWSLKLDDKSSRTIDTHLSNLRQKLGDNPKEPKFIQSVWGIGYKFIS